jgi:hypothetical protein
LYFLLAYSAINMALELPHLHLIAEYASLAAQRALSMASKSLSAAIKGTAYGSISAWLGSLDYIARSSDPSSWHSFRLALQTLGAHHRLRQSLQAVEFFASELFGEQDQWWELHIGGVRVEKQSSTAWAPPFFSCEDSKTVQMRVEAAEPRFADAPLQNADKIKGKIAIVERGGCDFQAKAQHASSAGAKGLLVINNDDTGNELFNMTARDDECWSEVPLTLIGFQDGKRLLELAQNAADADECLIEIIPTDHAACHYYLLLLASRMHEMLKATILPHTVPTSLVLVDADSVAYSGFDGTFDSERVSACVCYYLGQGRRVEVLLTMREVERHQQRERDQQGGTAEAYARDKLQRLIEHGLVVGIPDGVNDTLWIARHANEHAIGGTLSNGTSTNGRRVVVTNEVLPLPCPMLHFRFKVAGGVSVDDSTDSSTRSGCESRRRCLQYNEVPHSMIEYPPGVKVNHVDLFLPS